jgi:hypothetical protein
VTARRLSGSTRIAYVALALFSCNRYVLEAVSQCSNYIVPMAWLNIAVYFFLRGCAHSSCRPLLLAASGLFTALAVGTKLYYAAAVPPLKSYVIQADETPVPVFDPTRDATRTGYLWGKRGDAEHPYVVYDYSDSRSRDGPAEFFKDYRGHLQTDAYAVYESVVDQSKGRIIAVGWCDRRMM